MIHKLVMIVSRGSLDTAYPPLILASTAVTLGMEAHLFFTFWGMLMIRKDVYDKLSLSTDGEKASGMNAEAMAKAMSGINMPSLPEMIKMAKEAGVKFHACSNSVEMMRLKKEDLIPEVDDIVGAATVLTMAKDDAILLYT
jgi:peroxiredoxin family protein